MPDKETRIIPAGQMRLVRAENGPPRAAIEGYAALFNSPSVDLGGFTEVIARGAFSDALAKPHDVRALFNHDPNNVLARTKSGTLILREDDRGLRMIAELPDTQVGRDLAVSMERGDIDQMSFAFDLEYGKDEKWSKAGPSIRTITRIRNLYDVSVVTYPAYPDTTVALRTLKEMQAKNPAAASETTPDAKAAHEMEIPPPGLTIDERFARAKERDRVRIREELLSDMRKRG